MEVDSNGLDVECERKEEECQGSLQGFGSGKKIGIWTEMLKE